MKKMNFLDWLALILVVIGGINWGLIGLFNFDLVSAIFGSMTLITRAVFTLVGVAAIYVAFMPAMMESGDYMTGRPTAKSM